MYDDILRALYDGQIAPWEQESPPTARRAMAQKAYNDAHAEFSGELRAADSKLADRLEELLSVRNGLSYEECAQAFAQGFTLGGRFMLPVLGPDSTDRAV